MQLNPVSIAIARPGEIRFTDALAKTRSSKIIRHKLELPINHEKDQSNSFG